MPEQKLITREQLEKEWGNEPTVVMSREQFIKYCLRMRDNGLEAAAWVCESRIDNEAFDLIDGELSFPDSTSKLLSNIAAEIRSLIQKEGEPDAQENQS